MKKVEVITSKPMDLIREDVVKILIGAGINFGGALLFALGNYAIVLLEDMKFSGEPLLVALLTAGCATLVNVLRTYLKTSTYTK